MRMHEGEIGIDESLVRQLLVQQFPRFANLPITRYQSIGTVNAIYRLGSNHCVRMPLLEQWAADIKKEWSLLEYLAKHLTLRVPEPVAFGEATQIYPYHWAVYRWIDGMPYSDEVVEDEREVAAALATFVIELRRVELRSDAPRGGRRPLAELDGQTRKALQASADVIDVDAAISVWELSLDAPEWNGDAVWIHADLLRPNLLIQHGKLAAVIDFGSLRGW